MPSRRRFIQSNVFGLGFAFAGRTGLPAAFSPTTETIPPRDDDDRNYWNDWPRYLAAEMNDARSRRLAQLSAMQTEPAVRARIEKIRSTVWKLIGGPFEKTPLKPQIIGTIDRGPYRIEKIIFESRPEVFVTANLYIPNHRQPPYPGILHPLGHADNGKAATPINTFLKPWPEKGTWSCRSIPSARASGCSISTSAPGRVSTAQPVNTIELVGRCYSWDRSLRSIGSGTASEPSIIFSLAPRSIPSV